MEMNYLKNRVKIRIYGHEVCVKQQLQVLKTTQDIDRLR